MGRRAGEVSLSDLVVDALRLNLRRIIVGEVRGPEVLPMLEAMSTGDGSLCTLHARTAAHAIDRIVTLCLSAGVHMTDTFAYRLLAGSVDLLVHIEPAHRARPPAPVRLPGAGGQRAGETHRPATTAVFGPGPDGRAVPLHRPEFLPDLVRAGFDERLLDHRDGTWPTPMGGER